MEPRDVAMARLPWQEKTAPGVVRIGVTRLDCNQGSKLGLLELPWDVVRL